jgi:hypothetical protein
MKIPPMVNASAAVNAIPKYKKEPFILSSPAV